MHKTNCHCLKCDKKWFSQIYYLANVLPKACPRCHRYDWMKPRVRKRRIS